MDTVPCTGGVGVSGWLDYNCEPVIPDRTDNGQVICRLLSKCFCNERICSISVGSNIEVIEKRSFEMCHFLSHVHFDDGSRWEWNQSMRIFERAGK